MYHWSTILYCQSLYWSDRVSLKDNNNENEKQVSKAKYGSLLGMAFWSLDIMYSLTSCVHSKTLQKHVKI